MSSKLPVFPACLLPKLLPRVPLHGPQSFFVQEARRSGVCVTKMAQGRRPAFCCLSEECLLSGAGGNRRGAGTEKSGALKGPKGRKSPPMPNEHPLAAFVASPRRQTSTKSRLGESHKLAASPEWMSSFVLLLSATLV